jgi:hypothetical protein
LKSRNSELERMTLIELYGRSQNRAAAGFADVA